MYINCLYVFSWYLQIIFMVFTDNQVAFWAFYTVHPSTDFSGQMCRRNVGTDKISWFFHWFTRTYTKSRILKVRMILSPPTISRKTC